MVLNNGKLNSHISSLNWHTINVKQQEEDYEYPEIPTAKQTVTS